MQLLTESQQKNIIRAIGEAEKKTSGEIKVHVEEKCPGLDPFTRAVEVFNYLSLDKTAMHNGVLLYLAYGDRKFAVIGDKGINNHVKQELWNSVKDILGENFKIGDYENGFIESIRIIGDTLKEYFPVQSNDINELPDDISFG